MKITARIAAAMGQLKASVAHKLGNAFGRSASVAENPGLNRVQTEPTAMVKTAKGDVQVIKNMSVNFAHDNYEVIKNGKITGYLVHATHNDVTMQYPNDVISEEFSCRHMIVEELARREAEKAHPHIHTKADRAKVFDVKHASFMAAQRQRLESRLHDLLLYSNDVHIFNNEKMGMFLEAAFRKLKVGEVKNFGFFSNTHAMTLTLKRKDEGYSVSLWDPNRTAEHIKMKFSSPVQASKISVETLLGPERTARLTRASPNFKACELPKGWAEDKPKYTSKIRSHYYELGPKTTEVTKRAEWINDFPGANIS